MIVSPALQALSLGAAFIYRLHYLRDRSTKLFRQMAHGREKCATLLNKNASYFIASLLPHASACAETSYLCLVLQLSLVLQGDRGLLKIMLGSINITLDLKFSVAVVGYGGMRKLV